MMDQDGPMHDEFPILRDRVYLNHAAVAPIPARAGRALREFADEAVEGGGALWGRWAARLKAARAEAARLLDVQVDDVAFVHNTTHGLLCIANSLPWRPGDNIVGMAADFPANVHPWRNLAQQGVALRAVEPGPDQRYRAEDFAALLDDRTRLVALSLVHYASGCRLPVERIAEICRRRGVRLCVDAIQAVGALPTRPADLGCDYLVADGHKWMLGPEGLGILWVHPDRIEEMNVCMTGWTGRVRYSQYEDYDQPLLPNARRFEEGSYNMAGAAALGQSLALLNEIGIDEVWRRLDALTGRLREGLRSAGWTIVSPDGEGERSGITSAARAGVDVQALVNRLEERRISVSPRGGRLRIAPHFYNTAGQLDELIAALRELA